jgi:hypothetical protein
MTAPSFVARAAEHLPLYWMNPAPPPDLPQYQVGFWTPSATQPTVPFTLGDSWTSRTGVYLFLQNTPAEPDAFALKLIDILQQPAFVNARFLWIANPDALVADWKVQSLAASQPAGVVDPPGDLVFRNYRLFIGATSTVALNGTSDGFTITPPSGTPDAIWFGLVGGTPFTLTSGAGSNLPFTGDAIGALSFALETDATNFFGDIDSGVRYFLKDPFLPWLDLVKSLKYPVFTGAPGQALSVILDPANPLSYNRTYLGFPNNGAPLSTHFSTNYGNALQLVPSQSDFAPCGPRLAFAPVPIRTDDTASDEFYMVPAGSFTVAPVNEPQALTTDAFTPPTTRLMCGTAGVEYLGLMAAAGSQLHFFPNQPAYAPSLGASTEESDAAARTLAATSTEEEPLTDLGLTSWMYTTPPAGSSVVYFAQPDDASLYGATASQYLQFLEVPSGTLQDETAIAARAATDTNLTPAFPMVPYTGVVADAIAEYAQMEQKILAPLRRALIGGLTTTPAALAATEEEETVSGATPQGLLLDLDPTRTQWRTLTLAKLDAEALLLHDVQGGFREALQTNRLFAVLSDPAVVMDAAELEYEITAEVIQDLATKLNPVPQSVLEKLVPMIGTTYRDDSAFQPALKTALGETDYAAYGGVITQYAAKFDLEIDSWRFRLSPTMWSANPDARTICIFKYNDRPLQALAEDTTQWAWPAAAGDVADTQKRLLQILNDAAAAVDSGGKSASDLAYFVNVVMRNPAWNGVLFLNANVPLSALPPDLSGLVSGIKPEKFYGHHFGIELTPVQPGVTLSLGNSSLFGLILYDDPEDLFFNGELYDFKVLLLKVLFANSGITGFASRIQLMTNGYFGDRGDLLASEHNNNLILEGSRQLQGDTATYVYLQEGSNVFVMRSKVLREVEVTKTQFVTLVPASGSVTDVSSKSRFLLWGKLRFNPLQGFDLFSFGPTIDPVTKAVTADGYLPFSNLSIDMASDGTAGGKKTFAFNTKDITFDTAAAIPRTNSFYARFPLVSSGLTSGKVGTKPADLGYFPVKTPMSAGALEDEWYALTFQLDLGTLGALAGQGGFVVSLAASWSPSATDTKAQTGLQLPGGRNLTSLLSIQGVVKLGFNNISITAAEQGASGIAYMLKFNRFGLQLLGLTFPPGQSDLYFFGNPNNNDRTSIGWYAAYLK